MKTIQRDEPPLDPRGPAITKFRQRVRLWADLLEQDDELDPYEAAYGIRRAFEEYRNTQWYDEIREEKPNGGRPRLAKSA